MDFVAQRKLKTLVETNTRINSGICDKDVLVRDILESAMRLVKCERALFWLCDKDGDVHFASEIGKKKEVAEFYDSAEKAALYVSQKKQHEFFTGSNYEILVIPACYGDECLGVLQLAKKKGPFSKKSDLQNIWILCEFSASALRNADILENSRLQIYARESISCVDLSTDNRFVSDEFIAKSRVMLDLLTVANTAAQTDAPVLIMGEHGVGKKLLAEKIYLKSKRADKKFVRINCAALFDLQVLDAILADAQKLREDTIFFDDISLISDSQEAQEKVIQVMKCGARIIASSSQDLQMLIAREKFNADIYRGLSAVVINVPPLRSHKDDILPLADFFVVKSADSVKKKFVSFSDDAKKVLLSYKWHGNVTELKNAVERACINGNPPVITAGDLFLGDETLQNSITVPENKIQLKDAVNDFKRQHIVSVLEGTNWNQTVAAKILGVQRTYLSRLMKDLEIREH